MGKKEFGRRRFLRSTATAGIGVAGGIAATGTAAANSDEIRLYSNSNYWEYQVHTTTGYDDLERGSEAEQHDTFPGWGNEFADGEISDGGVDNFWIDSGESITQINATYNDYGWIRIEVDTTATYRKGIGVRRDENPDWPGYDYTIDVDGSVEPNDNNGYFDYGQDSASGGTFSGTIDTDDIDSAWTTGPLSRVFLEDPNSPGLGLTIDLPV